MPVRFRPVPNEIIIGKLRCCFARCSKIRNGSTHILLRVLAVNVTRSDDLGRVASVVLKLGVQGCSPCGAGSSGCRPRASDQGATATANAPVPKYGKPEIGCDDGGDARHVSLSVNDIVEHLRHLRPSPLR
jgi:hypothetical protein